MTTAQEMTGARTMAGAGEATGARDRATAVLVTADWLEEHLADPGVRVVEVDVSRAGYDE
jgi:hypothetical protein